MNRHLAIKISCFSVVKLRNSPAITCIPRLESDILTGNLLDPDLIRGSLGIFIYNPSQYQDAIALINNHDHIVQNPMDVDVFYNSLNSEQSTKSAYKVMNDFILGMVVFGLICGLLIYVLS